MKIERSKKHEAQVLKKVKAWLSRRPRSQEAWHVSDLLYPRKAYWQRVKPQPMTDDQAGYFVAGQGHHSVIEAILGSKKEHGRADAGEFFKHGILFSPDLRLPYPLEIKTSRRQREPSKNALTTDYEGYLKQLCSYQALMGQVKGALLVFYLNLKEGSRTKPRFRFYKVTMTKAELTKKVAELIQGAKALTTAVENKVWSKLPLCPLWLCRDCSYYTSCKPWLQDKSRKGLQ